MLHTKIIDTKDSKLSIQKAENFISSQDYGASIFFTGTVRNQNNDQIVTGMTYDSHDDLVIKSFEEIYNEANQKLNIKDKSVFIEHAKGYLTLGEISIVIAVVCFCCVGTPTPCDFQSESKRFLFLFQWFNSVFVFEGSW